jgi:DNA-binding MarR family transcriptional regulator
MTRSASTDSAKGRPPAASRAPDAAQVLRKFRLIFNSVKSHFREVEREAGIAGAQVWALNVIGEQPGIGVSALARALDIRQSTASNLIKPMIEAGLLLAARADTDRRALKLQLTAKGRRVLKKAPGPAEGVLPKALGQLDAATLGRLDKDLQKVIGLVHGDPRAAMIPLGQPTAARE